MKILVVEDHPGLLSAIGEALEAEKFNAEQRQSAYDQAYSAALALYAQYKKSGTRGKSGGVNKTTLENCEAFLAMLTGEERKAVYSASTAQGKQYRAELLASVGAAGYVQLMGKYPSKQ